MGAKISGQKFEKKIGICIVSTSLPQDIDQSQRGK